MRVIWLPCGWSEEAGQSKGLTQDPPCCPGRGARGSRKADTPERRTPRKPLLVYAISFLCDAHGVPGPLGLTFLTCEAKQ